MDGNRSAQDILDEIVDRSKRPPSPFYEQTRRMRPLPVLSTACRKGRRSSAHPGDPVYVTLESSTIRLELSAGRVTIPKQKG